MRNTAIIAVSCLMTISSIEANLMYRPHLGQQLLAQQGNSSISRPQVLNPAPSGQSAAFSCPNPRMIQVSSSRMGTNKASAPATQGMPQVLGRWTSYGTGVFLNAKADLIFLSVSLNKVNTTSTVNGQTTQGVGTAPTCNYLDKVSKVLLPLGPENLPAIKHFSYKLNSGGQSSKNLNTKIMASPQSQANLHDVKSHWQSTPAGNKAEQRLSSYRFSSGSQIAK